MLRWAALYTEHGKNAKRGREGERRGDKETRRQGDKETGRQGDRETGRQGDRETRANSQL
jgi:hypothetical protein